MLRTAPTLLLLSTLLSTLLAAQVAVGREVVAMGTELGIEIEAADRRTALAASEALVLAVEAVEQRLSVWRPDSDVSRINAAAVGKAVSVAPSTVADLQWGLRFACRVGGAFDATAGPLIAVYGLREQPRWPRDRELAAALADVGARHFGLTATAVVRHRSGSAFDCDGYAKGVALDQGLAAATAAGARRVFCDFGGQVMNHGEAARPVELEIADPDDRGRTVHRLRLRPGCSAATSGNSRRAVMVDGGRLGHLIDPRTGRPARDFGSVTVIAPDATTADAAATALFVLGPDRGREMALRLHLDAVFVLRDACGAPRIQTTTIR
ncbi:MAG: FAD:protein FMN transferase [Planctomycetes bacterium]|nr:FAD:protein FMN transferase [Planctomycetota bacterium]